MRFAQLPVGERFRYQGELYIKTAPLIASQVEGDKQRMIPRSAAIEPEGTTAPPPAPGDTDGAAEAVQRFHREAERLLDRVAAGESPESARAALTAARDACLDALNKRA